MQKYLPVLKQVSLFADIAETDLLAMLHCLSARARQYQKNSYIWRAEEKARAVGVVLDGAVQIIREDYAGNRLLMARLGTSQLFGETFSCARVEKLPVSVIAAADSTILLLDYRRIITTCSSACPFHSHLIGNMLGILAAKNILLNQKIECLCKRTIRDKLLTYLAAQQQKKGGGFTVPFNRQELADYLCTDRSALSNELSKLRKEGLLECQKNHFRLL